MAGKKGKQASENERKRVVALRMEGYSIAEVAKMLNRSQGFVKQWARRQWPSLKNKKRASVTRKLTPSEAKRFITNFVKDKWSRGYRKADKALNVSGILGNGVSVHPSSVLRYIKSQTWGKNAYKMEVKPLRKDTQVEKRLVACNHWHRQGFLDDTEEGRKKAHYEHNVDR